MMETPPSANHQPDTQNTSILFMLGQLTAKVDALLSSSLQQSERHDLLENRVTALEKAMAKVIGAAIVASTLAGFLLDYLFKR